MYCTFCTILYCTVLLTGTPGTRTPPSQASPACPGTRWSSTGCSLRATWRGTAVGVSRQAETSTAKLNIVLNFEEEIDFRIKIYLNLKVLQDQRLKSLLSPVSRTGRGANLSASTRARRGRTSLRQGHLILCCLVDPSIEGRWGPSTPLMD